MKYLYSSLNFHARKERRRKGNVEEFELRRRRRGGEGMLTLNVVTYKQDFTSYEEGIEWDTKRFGIFRNIRCFDFPKLYLSKVFVFIVQARYWLAE